MRHIVSSLVLGLFCLLSCLPSTVHVELQGPTNEADWPGELPWWQRNNLRVMQCNLPAYEAQLDVDSLINDLRSFSVNTLIINGGGIMAFYATQLEFQYINPFMRNGMLAAVINKCHKHDIRVITRFDFSRLHETIFRQHPDWCYISPKGERITNDDMVLASINAPYVQEKSLEIIEEVMDSFPIDGIFINMPGYYTRNAYEGIYYGIDQNEHDRKRFASWSGGLTLPDIENPDNPVFQKYMDFKKHMAREWIKQVRNTVKSKNPNAAVCTYMDAFVDIIRHESQTHGHPYWPYMSSDNVNSTVQSNPNHIVSNASIQQLSFRSRYNAIEPEETAIRLYENIANGSGLDMSLMGDFQDYEDERNFESWRKIYAHHKKYEPYYGKYFSIAEVCLISKGYWPGGDQAQESRGLQLMLKESHIPFDIIEAAKLESREEALKKYKVFLVPDLATLPKPTLKLLKERCQSGATLIATNQSFHDDPKALSDLFGAQLIEQIEANGHYLNPEDKSFFTRFKGQKLVHTSHALGFYDFSAADQRFMKIFTPGRPGPPEKIGGHKPSGYFAVAIKNHEKGKAIFLPFNIGKQYYLNGYEQHKNILLDILSHSDPTIFNQIQTNAHERVEVILQDFIENTPENIFVGDTDGKILHLINLTGFSGNSYFQSHVLSDLQFKIKCEFKPSYIYSMVSEEVISFSYNDGFCVLTLDKFRDYDGLIIKR